jgi:hypothetical protein
VLRGGVLQIDSASVYMPHMSIFGRLDDFDSNFAMLGLSLLGTNLMVSITMITSIVRNNVTLVGILSSRRPDGASGVEKPLSMN